jgi:hypothetical protein
VRAQHAQVTAALEAKLPAAAAHLDAAQNDEWTESRRYMGLEILAACRKAAQLDMGQDNASGAELTVGAIPAAHLAGWSSTTYRTGKVTAAAS